MRKNFVIPIELERRQPSMNWKPFDLLRSPIGTLHRRLQDQFRGAPDVGSDAITLDEGNDRTVRDVEFTSLVYPDPGTLSGIR